MKECKGTSGVNKNDLRPVADTLFSYLHDIIYDADNASLDLKQLPDEFADFGQGLLYFSNAVLEVRALAKEMSNGNLNCDLPPPGNEIAAPLKMLHASLRHLTWQTQQVAQGDYQQRVDFMGDFSKAFNNMVAQLDQRQKIVIDEKIRLERYVDLMLANCIDPILLFNRKGELTHVSDSYLHCSAHNSISDILGRSLFDLFREVVPEEFLTYIVHQFDAAIQEKRTIETSQEIDLRKNGSTRYYQIQVTPMLDAEGIVEGVMLLLHDITDIVRSRREAEYARELAEQSSRAKSDFLARMSHEMRTPMNAIIGMTAIYNSTGDAARKGYCIERIDEASRHLLGVINDILDMSKIEADKLEISHSKFDFEKMIKRVTGVVMFRIEERRQHLTMHIDPRIPPWAVGDEQRLAQVITNLLSNAVKFTPEDGEIFFSANVVTEEDHGCIVRFMVKDNGIGIAKEQQGRLFTPFEQADGGISRRFGGTGLGLAISKRIVEMMGGVIWVESEIDHGSSFVFEIPLEKAYPLSINQPEATRNDSEDGTPETGEDGIFAGRTVLLAEDVEINREVLISLLEHTGLCIDLAVDGMDAVEKYAVQPNLYDLILMDIHMPNLDGYEATRQIRSSGLPGAETIPIVAMTANVFREDVERCLESGMNSHLGKPIDASEVIAHLKDYLRP